MFGQICFSKLVLLVKIFGQIGFSKLVFLVKMFGQIGFSKLVLLVKMFEQIGFSKSGFRRKCLGKLVQQIGTFGENVWANWF